MHRTVFPGSFPKWCKDGGIKAVQALAGVMCPGATMHYWHSRKIVQERRRVSQRKHSQNLLSETNDNNLGAMLEGVPCLVDLSDIFGPFRKISGSQGVLPVVHFASGLHPVF